MLLAFLETCPISYVTYSNAYFLIDCAKKRTGEQLTGDVIEGCFIYKPLGNFPENYLHSQVSSVNSFSKDTYRHSLSIGESRRRWLTVRLHIFLKTNTLHIWEDLLNNIAETTFSHKSAYLHTQIMLFSNKLLKENTLYVRKSTGYLKRLNNNNF